MELAYGFEYQAVPTGRRSRAHVWLRAVAPPAPGEQTRAPLNLAMVLDRSGSMRGPKLQCTKDAARQLVDMLGPKDLLSIVLYDTEVTDLLRPSPIANRDSIKRLLDGIIPRGSTNLSGGWLQGIAHVEKMKLKTGVNRVLLMTDGLANRGIVETPDLVKIATKKRKKGVSTSTFGFGEGFAEDLLISIARAAGGSFYYIENPDDAPRAFMQELGSLLTVVAQNLVFRLEAAGGARFLTFLNGYTHTFGADAIEANAGDLNGGDQRGLVIEMDMPAGLPADGSPVATATLEYLDVGEDPGRQTAQVELRAKGGAVDDFGARDPEVAREVALLKSARAKEQAIRRADAGDHEGARQALQSVIHAFRNDPLCQDTMQEEIAELRRFVADLDNATFDARSRKSLSASIFQSQMGMSRVGLAKGRVDTRVDTKGEQSKAPQVPPTVAHAEPPPTPKK
ncbi:MAG: VWA domain-containing protein [Planctomycetales bacterium]|nr:VWA domain-containing protein [Planctomycetales bacterium]